MILFSSGINDVDDDDDDDDDYANSFIIRIIVILGDWLISMVCWFSHVTGWVRKTRYYVGTVLNKIRD